MDAPLVNIEDLVISQESLQKLMCQEALIDSLEKRKSVQEILGFKDEAVLIFYGAAKEVFLQKRFKEAVKAFFFLTSLAPHIPAFWIGLGLAQQENLEFEKAAESFQTASELDNPWS